MAETRDKRRAFTQTQKNEILHQQDNKCAICHKKLDPRAIEFDHRKEWSASGKTIIRNGAALCPTCHRIKTHNSRVKKIDKPQKERKLASKEYLNNLTVKQLKYLAKKHGITPSAKVIRDLLWGTSKVTTSKRQYVNSLFGEVYEGEKLSE
jgi:predicted restriction endonuclease